MFCLKDFSTWKHSFPPSLATFTWCWRKITLPLSLDIKTDWILTVNEPSCLSFSIIIDLFALESSTFQSFAASSSSSLDFDDLDFLRPVFLRAVASVLLTARSSKELLLSRKIAIQTDPSSQHPEAPTANKFSWCWTWKGFKVTGFIPSGNASRSEMTLSKEVTKVSRSFLFLEFWLVAPAIIASLLSDDWSGPWMTEEEAAVQIASSLPFRMAYIKFDTGSYWAPQGIKPLRVEFGLEVTSKLVLGPGRET